MVMDGLTMTQAVELIKGLRGPALVALDDGVIKFDMNLILHGEASTDEAGRWYQVPLSRCSSMEEIVGWVSHLCLAHSRWVTPALIDDFIDVACRANNLEVPRV
jgi:hypothetical protein